MRRTILLLVLLTLFFLSKQDTFTDEYDDLEEEDTEVLNLPKTYVSQIQDKTLMNPGDRVISANTFHKLQLVGGNLVLLNEFDQKIWETKTSNQIGFAENTVVFENCQLKVLAFSLETTWASNGVKPCSTVECKCTLSVQDDRNVVIYGPSSQVVWKTGTTKNPTFLSSEDTGILLYQENITSINSLYYLKIDNVGKLQLKDRLDNTIWQTQGSGMVDSFLKMQKDGNLVLYNKNSVPYWSTKTSGSNGPFRFFIQEDRNLVVYDGRGVALWSSNSAYIPDRISSESIGKLFPGERLTSQNGLYSLQIVNGDLRLLGIDNAILWSTGAVGGTPNHTLVMQHDGNLVIYDKSFVGKWSSNTFGKGSGVPYTLVVQNDRNLVLYSSGGNPVWSTNTGVPPPPSLIGTCSLNGKDNKWVPDQTSLTSLISKWYDIGVFGLNACVYVGENVVFKQLKWAKESYPFKTIDNGFTNDQIFQEIKKYVIDNFKYTKMCSFTLQQSINTYDLLAECSLKIKLVELNSNYKISVLSPTGILGTKVTSSGNERFIPTYKDLLTLDADFKLCIVGQSQVKEIISKVESGFNEFAPDEFKQVAPFDELKKFIESKLCGGLQGKMTGSYTPYGVNKVIVSGQIQSETLIGWPTYQCVPSTNVCGGADAKALIEFKFSCLDKDCNAEVTFGLVGRIGYAVGSQSIRQTLATISFDISF